MKKQTYKIKVTYTTKKGKTITARRSTTSRNKYVQYQLKRGLVPLKTSSMKQTRWVKQETFNRKIQEEKDKIDEINRKKKTPVEVVMKKYVRLIAGKTWYSRNLSNTPFPVVATYLYTIVESDRKQDGLMKINYSRLDALEKLYVFRDKYGRDQVELIDALTDVREIKEIPQLETLQGSEEREIDEDEFQNTGQQLGIVYFSWAWFKNGRVAFGYPKSREVEHV